MRTGCRSSTRRSVSARAPAWSMSSGASRAPARAKASITPGYVGLSSATKSPALNSSAAIRLMPCCAPVVIRICSGAVWKPSAENRSAIASRMAGRPERGVTEQRGDGGDVLKRDRVVERQFGARRDGQRQVDRRLGPGDERREQGRLGYDVVRAGNGRRADDGAASLPPVDEALLLQQPVRGHDRAAADMDRAPPASARQGAACRAGSGLARQRCGAQRPDAGRAGPLPSVHAPSPPIRRLVSSFWSICPRLALEKIAKDRENLAQYFDGL